MRTCKIDGMRVTSHGREIARRCWRGRLVCWLTATVRTTNGVSIARCYQGDKDAALIASAPDLLLALREAVARIELANESEGNPILSAWLPGAKEAVAKAEGR